jgi:hypothetical protein
VASPFDASGWLLHELTQFDVKVNTISFPAESREIIFFALDDVLKLAVSISQNDPLAFHAYIAFVLFPKLVNPRISPS